MQISSKRFITFSLVVIIIDGLILGMLYWKNNQINQYTYASNQKTTITPTKTPKKVFTKDELIKYNGDNPNLPVYLALDGNVYDVSVSRKDYYDPGKSYHDIAGKDSSQILHLFGGAIIKKKYPIVGTYK
jgi:predicted heme/steroid binding protein